MNTDVPTVSHTGVIPAPLATSPPYMAPIEPSVLSHEIMILVIPLVVIILGLVIERILNAYKR